MFLSLILASAIRTDIYILVSVSVEYGLDRQQTKLLYAIYRSENGSPGSEMGVLNKQAQRFRGDRYRSLQCQSRWCAGTIKKRYTGDLRKFADIYCPIGADNDPNNLNRYWYKNVSFWMSKLN